MHAAVSPASVSEASTRQKPLYHEEALLTPGTHYLCVTAKTKQGAPWVHAGLRKSSA